jgi:hypothetical protein
MDEIKAAKRIPANRPGPITPPFGVRWFRNSTMGNVAPILCLPIATTGYCAAFFTGPR